MQVQSQKKVQKDLEFYEEFELFPKDHVKYIGNLALKIISEEYNAYLNHYENQWCPWCCLRNIENVKKNLGGKKRLRKKN